jgi:hypothetical protein
MEALNVGSQILLRVVKVFNEAESVPHGTTGWYPNHITTNAKKKHKVNMLQKCTHHAGRSVVEDEALCFSKGQVGAQEGSGYVGGGGAG